MSAHILQRIYALNIHLLTSRTKGVFIFIPYHYLFHTNLLLVEAVGTAPTSSSVLNSYHQIVSYLYHVTGLKSMPFFSLFSIKAAPVPVDNEHNQPGFGISNTVVVLFFQFAYRNTGY